MIELGLLKEAVLILDKASGHLDALELINNDKHAFHVKIL